MNFTGPTSINPVGSSDPDQFTQVNATVYFSANETNSNRGVFRYNGSSAPTRLTFASTPGALVNPRGMIGAGDRLFFAADNSQDGTQGLYAAISPRTTTLKILNTPVFMPGQMVAFGQHNYFLGSAGPGNNNSLFRTVDTYNGSTLNSIRALQVPNNINPNATWNNPQQLLIDGPYLYLVDKNAQGAFGIFQVTLSSDQSELYAEFTVKRVTDYLFSDISDLNISNSTLFFQATAIGVTKPQLLMATRSGTAPQFLTQPLTGTDPNLFKVDLVGPMRLLNSQVFFAGNGATGGTELYTTNGTASGTKLALEINPVGNGLDPVDGLKNSVVVPNALVLAASGGVLTPSAGQGPDVFTAYGMEPASIPVALDGSLNSKNPINFIDLFPGTTGSNPTQFVKNNYQVFFSATDPDQGRELFTTQGLSSNTFQLKDFNPNGSSNPTNLAVRDGSLYLSANDGVNGSELYVGTTFETRTTSEISANSPLNRSLVNVSGNLFYVVASDLFVSDGTRNGTRAVTTSSGVSGIAIDSMRSFNGALYFLRSNASNRLELWFSRASTTTPVLPVTLIPAQGQTVPQFSATAQIVNVSDNYLYIADNRNLYQIDVVGNISLKATNFVFANPTTNSVAGRSLTNANGTLFFAGFESANNFGLYRLAPGDPTARKIGDIAYLTGQSQPINFGSIQGRTFFTALDDFTGNSLFSTTGIPEGAVNLQDIKFIRSLDASTTLNTYSNLLFFGSPTDPLVGNEPWVSDGILSGTRVLRNINLNNNGQAPSNPTSPVGNGRFALISAADQGTTGTTLSNFEPYIITGFDSPVINQLKALNPQNPQGSQPSDFLAVGNQMFFTADLGTGGITNRVLFATQGTSATTNRVVTAAGTPNSVDNLANLEGNVAFRALSPTVGAPVLWNAAVDPLATPVRSILRNNPSTIRVDAPPSSQVVFKVTFNFDVDPTSVDANDFVIVKDATLTGPRITSVTQETPGDPRSYLITVSLTQNASSFGKLTINTNPRAVVRAIAPGNPTVDLGLPVKNPEAYQVNPKAPVVTSIDRFNPPGTVSNGGTVTFRVNFSEDIIANSVNASDFSVTSTGTVTVPPTFIGTITQVTGDPRSFLVQVVGISGQGSLRLNVVPTATIVSTAGIPYAQGGFTGGQFYTIDSLRPVLSEVLQYNPISGDTVINNPVVVFQTVFSEAINPATVDPSDFSSGLFGATVVKTEQLTSSTFTVSVAVPNAAGVLNLLLNPNADIQDVAGNRVDTSVTPNPSQTYNVNRVAPTIQSINRFNPINQSTANSQVVFQVAFSTAMNASTVVPTAFQMNTTGTLKGTVQSVTPVTGSPNLFNVTVGGFGGSGNVNLFVLPNSGMKDASGNPMFDGFASNNPNNQVYTIQDLTPPEYVGMVVVPNQDPAITLINLQFSEAVTGLTNAAFQAKTNTGQLLIAELNPNPTPGQYSATYQIRVTGYQGAGSFTLDFTNTGGIMDLANLPLNAPVGEVVGSITVNYAVRTAKPIVTTPGIPGTAPVVQINYANGTSATLTAFRNFLGGVRATTGDTNGDGVEDIIVAAQLGGRSHIRVFNGATLQRMQDFFPFDGYMGGVSIAATDMNNDGIADIIAGVTSAFPNQAAGAPPHVVAFNGLSGQVLASYYAYSPAFLGGVNVAGGDVNNDGFGDIITTPSFGGPVHVRVVSGRTLQTIQSYFGISPAYLGGAFITSADFNNDGFDDVAVSTNLGIPFVVVISGRNPNTQLDAFYPLNPQQPTGARVGYMINNQGEAKLLLMPGYNSQPLVQVLTYSIQGFYVESQFLAGFNSLNQGGIPG